MRGMIGKGYRFSFYRITCLRSGFASDPMDGRPSPCCSDAAVLGTTNAIAVHLEYTRCSV
jgi:hypothetical protein